MKKFSRQFYAQNEDVNLSLSVMTSEQWSVVIDIQ